MSSHTEARHRVRHKLVALKDMSTNIEGVITTVYTIGVVDKVVFLWEYVCSPAP
jgi:hypothetical protein